MRNIFGRKIVGVLILFFCSNALFAQMDEYNMPNHDDKPFYFGIYLAGSTNSFRLSQHPKFLTTDSIYVTEPGNNVGFGLGITANFRLHKRWEFRTIPFNLIFANRNIFYRLKFPDFAAREDSVTVKNVQSVLYSVPFQFKFKSDRIKNFRVYMFAGGKYEFDFASNANRRNSEEFVKLKPADWGVELGLGFNFYYPAFIFSPEIKISNGVTNRHFYDPNLKFSNSIDRITSRMVVIGIHLEGVLN
jgi:hypothetical protein